MLLAFLQSKVGFSQAVVFKKRSLETLSQNNFLSPYGFKTKRPKFF